MFPKCDMHTTFGPQPELYRLSLLSVLDAVLRPVQHLMLSYS